jgi:diguanylate cyclase (GGDEF)-like protein
MEDDQSLTCYLQAPLPYNEAQRLKTLTSYGVLDSRAEHSFDAVAQLAALSCGTPLALISLIDRDRQWFKARVGIDACETERGISFCSHAILSPDEVMIIPDALDDIRFAGNPMVTQMPGIRFYAGAPLVSPTGEAIGTLCVADYQPRQLDDRQIEMLRGLAGQAMAQLELRRSLATLEASIEKQSSYVCELEQQCEQLVQENATDALTDLGNRRAFQQRLDEELTRASRCDSSMALMVLDVDCFKRYNDSFGHPAGDVLLKQLGEVLKSTCRVYDFAARIGGEEFAVILPGTTRASAFVIAERLRRTVQQEVWPHRQITVSVGVALLQSEIDDSACLLDRADRALYRAKNAGRNRVVVSEPLNIPTLSEHRERML